MDDRQALHKLVDELQETDFPAARHFFEYLGHQTGDCFRLDTAPLDDEPVTDEDLAAIREGHDERTRGETVSHEDVGRLLREAK